MVNESLNEIENPETRARLTGIQEVVLDFDQEVRSLEKQELERKALSGACASIGQRLLQECAAINKKIDEGLLPVEEARIRMDQAKRMVEVVRSIEADSRKDLFVLQGKISGLRAAAERAAKRFDETVQKYERHKRMEAEDRAERGEPEPKLTPEPAPPVTLFEGKVKTNLKPVKRKKSTK